MKTCSTCGEAKPLTEFRPQRRGCRACDRARTKRYYAANAEACRQRARAHYVANADACRQRASDARKRDPEKHRALVKDWQARNPEWVRQSNRLRTPRRRKHREARNWMEKYGISRAEHDRMRLRQHDKCANPACRVDFSTLSTKHIHVDHCHTTGYVRGLLCHWCNASAGNVRDDPAKLRGLAEYLDAAEAMRKIFEE